jgi:hypothetical protein
MESVTTPSRVTDLGGGRKALPAPAKVGGAVRGPSGPPLINRVTTPDTSVSYEIIVDRYAHIEPIAVVDDGRQRQVAAGAAVAVHREVFMQTSSSLGSLASPSAGVDRRGPIGLRPRSRPSCRPLSRPRAESGRENSAQLRDLGGLRPKSYRPSSPPWPRELSRYFRQRVSPVPSVVGLGPATVNG